MSEKQKSKIIQFPRAKKQAASAESSVLADLKASLSSATPEPAPNIDAPTPALHVVINGGKDVQVVNGNNTVNNYHAEKPPRPTVIVQTGIGVIDTQQKRRLLDLRDDVVATSQAGTPKTPGSVMGALNKHMKVSSYHEILAVDFKKAEKWMQRHIAIKTSLPSASKKLPDWRNRRIGAIHARCKEKGFEAWRITHMKKKFGKESMIDLSDSDLESLYRSVMSKKVQN